MKLYDLIKKLLENEPKFRDHDKLLMWEILKRKGLVLEGRQFEYIPQQYFLSGSFQPETIRRTRQKVQQDHPELASSKGVQQLKDEKERTKGTFVYREEL